MQLRSVVVGVFVHVQEAPAVFGLGWSVRDSVALIRTETGNEAKDYKPGNIFFTISGEDEADAETRG